MPSCLRAGSAQERGSNLIEFAFVLPLLLLMLVGVADLGRAFTTYIAITNAAREGARYASIKPWQRGAIVQAVVDEASLSGLSLSGDEIVIAVANAPVMGTELYAESGDSIAVTVAHEFPLILGGLLGLPEGSLTLRSRSSMVVFGIPEE